MKWLIVIAGLWGAFTVNAQCTQPNPLNVGFRVVQIPQGPRTAVWYPTEASETKHSYSALLAGSVAENAEPGGCERFPLILFSHGYAGCSTQSVALTEALARAGFIVAAPDHRDATCRADGVFFKPPQIPLHSFLTPWRWNEDTYDYRRRDLESVVQWILSDSSFAALIDPGHIGAMGHSLGGYSVLGLAGAWESWRDPRIAAVLALSPFVRPFNAHHRWNAIHVPVMLQGAQGDWSITPTLRGSEGAWTQASGPKYFLELKGGSHLEWTNLGCLGHRSVASCLEHKRNARLIVDYSVAFFEQYLSQKPDALTQFNGADLREWRSKE